MLRLGMVVCALAFVAVAVPGIGFIKAHADAGFPVSGITELSLPAHATYGVYVDDADNSGYSLSCTARDDAGGEIVVGGPSWSIGFSDTENLDAQFDTGSGEVTLNCSSDSAEIRVRPLPNDRALLLGFVVAGMLAMAGIALLAFWFSSAALRRDVDPRPR